MARPELTHQEYVESFIARESTLADPISPEDLHACLLELRREMMADRVRNTFRQRGLRYVERCIDYLDTRGRSIADNTKNKPTEALKAKRMRELYPD
jgi:hypothetical protein